MQCCRGSIGARRQGDAVGNPLILALCGEVDIAVTDPLRAAWYRVAERPEHEVIDIDLHEVTFMDARGLGLLVGMLNRQECHGGQLRLRGTPAPVRRLLQLTGLQGVFPVADWLPDAVIPAPSPG
jgi:anti-sigma B factor antagonist